ncbi:glycosyltransferase involved in cell wall biosynthesis [Edaphobacter aggregans]|uniref:Glycosyltransferase involved in cell wall biosynthesis n=1 Tax=Edaphobacter aggregans TaxID=570835 RepID=A0A428MKX6_9BACT|nr:glycosyltransferase family 4 protein [Edaphobacter aggregans]RSL17558.1 glycosyltransferase involved in cell wall biosynthesis [Edaphobacter aggregans]
MKILHIISSGGMYGAEAVILNMSRALNESGHNSVLGVFSNSSNPNTQLHEGAAKEGIESHLIPCKGQMDRTVLTSIRELASRTNADVIHAHGYKADIYLYSAMRMGGVPLVSTCHTWYDNDPFVFLYGVADRFVLRNYAAVVAVSDEVKQRLLKAGVRKEKIHLIRNGIDLRPFDNARPTLRGDSTGDAALIIGLVGRLSKEKGVDLFIRAAARALVEFPRARFLVLGEGPDRDKLESLIDELNIGDSLQLLGQLDNMPSIYASLDLMVSASRQEGLPIAILEGMASRLPVIATAVGDVPTVVLDGRTGVLVSAENIEALSAGIIELLRDTAKCKRLGVAARQFIEKEFSAERMTTDYLRVYESASRTSKARRFEATRPLGEKTK